MTAYLLTIGDEILIGQIVDTNSAWMAQQLNLQGIQITAKTSVGDVHSEIINAIDYALHQADLVLVTGGLGATKDDITKKALAEYFGVPMEWHQETYDRLEYFFKRVGRVVDDLNKNSCFMPAGAKILKNERGLAPGMWFEHGKKVLVSMPGVPYEMQNIMTERVLPSLRESFPMSPIVHRTILTAGEGETSLAAKLSDFEEKMPQNVKLAYLPSLGTVRLRLTARGEDEALLNAQLDVLQPELEAIIGSVVAGYGTETMPEIIGKILRGRGLKIGFAESCTGGHLTNLVTSVAGSSEYFEGSVIAYSYPLKEKLLGVPADLLNTFGAVSEECVRSMVAGAIQNLGVDVAAAVSGIAGPGGGTTEKPVGTIWIAAGDKDNIITTKIGIDRGRQKNMEYAANVALNLVRKFLLQREKA